MVSIPVYIFFIIILYLDSEISLYFSLSVFTMKKGLDNFILSISLGCEIYYLRSLNLILRHTCFHGSYDFFFMFSFSFGLAV